VKHIYLYLIFFLLSCNSSKELQTQLAEAQAQIALLQNQNKLDNAEGNQLVHIVFLKLNDNTTIDQKKELIDAIEELHEVETLNQLVIGEIAETNDPRFISDDELVFYIWVNNMEDYEFYQKHELHLKLKEIAKNHLERAPAVYDFWTR